MADQTFGAGVYLRSGMWSTVDEALTQLSNEGIAIAPHVLATLFSAAQGDAATLRELCTVLTEDQRRGLRVLLDPLPLVPAIEQRFSSIRLAPWERQILLAAAVCTDNRVDTLLDLAGRDISEIIASKVGSHLHFVAAHFSFDDPRFRIWIHGSSPLSECTTVHELLSAAYLKRGDLPRAHWHKSLCNLQGDSRLVRPLLESARLALHKGEVLRSVEIAREAASHAEGEPQQDAHLLAGLAALGGGYLDDAVEWLEPLITEGNAAQRSKALAGYLTAITMQRNVVPSVDAGTLDLDLTHPGQRTAWERTAALAAGLCAERADTAGTSTWLTRLSGLVDKSGNTDRLSAVSAWSALLAGKPAQDVSATGDSVSENLYEALMSGLDGRAHHGLAILAQTGNGLSASPDPLVQGFERTPLVRAYRSIIEALLHVWAGELAEAKSVIDRAAFSTPFARGFAGLGIVVARRVELAISGTTQTLSSALTFSMPGASSIDMVVDRAVTAYLAGSPDEAADQITVWTDRGAPHLCFGVPGLDEVGPFVSASAPESPDTTRGRNLRARLRQASENTWSDAYENVRVESRTIVSPFERARVEALLGELRLRRNDSEGRRHLLVASMLFSQSGATAWQQLVERTLAHFPAQTQATAPSAGSPDVSSGFPDPMVADEVFNTSNAVWSPNLTERELQVARLVADGASNKKIAEQLNVSVRTVEVHVGRVLAKLGVHNRIELVLRALRSVQSS